LFANMGGFNSGVSRNGGCAANSFSHLAEVLCCVCHRTWVLTCGPFVIFAGALVVFARQKGGISQLLQTTPLVYLGEISFALYMLHQIVVRHIGGNFWQQASAHPWAFYATYWGLSLIGAAVLFELVEKPGRSFIRRRFSAPRRTAVPVSAA
jgi:peptidoglycan/LPS O-acetylase OafA/YrhL